MNVVINSKRFGDKIIFKNFSLTIPDGATVLIRGESGKGKTTLLRLISGLDDDYSGSIDPNDAVLLFQEDRLIENMSVLSNLLLVTDDKNKARELLDEVGLEGEEKSIVSTLSGGMKRRVSISRLLLLERSMYLFDEPFTGLDDETKKRTAEVIKKRTAGKTIVVVSHGDDSISLFDSPLIVDL